MIKKNLYVNTVVKTEFYNGTLLTFVVFFCCLAFFFMYFQADAMNQDFDYDRHV